MTRERNVRSRIVEKSLKVVEARGAEAVSLREIARSLDVSTGAPYKHFPGGRVQVLGEVAAEGFADLEAALIEALQSARRSAQSARDLVGAAYVNFATARPQLFRLMFSQPIDAVNPVLSSARDGAYARLIEAITIDQAAGLCEPGDARTIALDSWVRAHGLSVLLNDGQIESRLVPPMDVSALMRLVFRAEPPGETSPPL